MDIQLWPDRPARRAADTAPNPPSWRVIIGALLAGIVIMGATAQVAYFFERTQEEVWLARGEVEYRGDSLVETIAVAMNSPGVWGPIAVRYGIEIKDFEERYRAEVLGGTQALSVEFEDPDPAVAQAIVTDVITSYLDQFAVIDQRAQDATLQDYLESLRTIERDLVVVLDDTTDLTRDEQIDRQNELIAVRQAITQVLLRLDDRASNLEALSELQPRVISEPYVLPEPIEPEPLKMAVVGAGAGGLLAVSAAFLLFHSDENRRRDPNEPPANPDQWDLAA